MEKLSITLANSIWFLNNGQADVLLNLNWVNNNLASILDIQLDQITESLFNKLTTLRKIVIGILNEKNISMHLEQLNQTLARVNYYNQVHTIDGELVIAQISNNENEDQLLSAIATDIIQLFINDKLAHVKICSNDECQFYFIDYSKNNSKKYCSSKCGTLIKVRRYRSKI